MHIRSTLTWLLGGLFTVCLCSPSSGVSGPVARVHSVMGDFDLLLLEESAPATVANFLNYVRDGDYVDMFFHRSVPGFVVQGGGFVFDETQGSAISVPTDPPLNNEFNVSNTRGTVAMARLGGQPDSATSQWFVNLLDNASLDSVDGGFSVFARVIGEGMNVVDAIAGLTVFNFGGAFQEMPTIDYDGMSQIQRGNLVIVSSVEEFPQLPPLFASVLPGGRSVVTGSPASGFATMINSGSTTAIACALQPLTRVAADFTMQTTDPLTNALTGTPDTPADIPAGSAQTFFYSFTPSQAFGATDVEFDFSCANTDAAVTISGLNTFVLSAASMPVPDIIALAATVTGDGVTSIAGVGGTGVFSVATVNVGSDGTISVSADTGNAMLPLTITLCETDPADARCLQPPAPLVQSQIGAGSTSTFSFFVQASGDIGFDPSVNRVFARFEGSAGNARGSSSVAVRTQ